MTPEEWTELEVEARRLIARIEWFDFREPSSQKHDGDFASATTDIVRHPWFIRDACKALESQLQEVRPMHEQLCPQPMHNPQVVRDLAGAAAARAVRKVLEDKGMSALYDASLKYMTLIVKFAGIDQPYVDEPLIPAVGSWKWKMMTAGIDPYKCATHLAMSEMVMLSPAAFARLFVPGVN